MSRSTAAILLTLLFPLVCMAGCKSDPPASPVPATAPASAPATKPATTRATTEPVPLTYIDVVRKAYPALATTRPLDHPLRLSESARLLLSDPIYLDGQGHLWITREDGAPTESALLAAIDTPGTEHVIRDRALFVQWMPNRGEWEPSVVIPANGDNRGTFLLVSTHRRQPIGRRDDYRWGRARSWTDGDKHRLIVPTTSGISIFTFASPRAPIVEAFQDLAHLGEPVPTQPAVVTALAAASANYAEPQFLFDPRGLVAWMPADPGKIASPGAARYLEGVWRPLLADAGWPGRILHLIPLRDGSVTQLILNEKGGVKLAPATLEAPRVVEKDILALVDKLADDEPKQRDNAYRTLAAYGPGIWPILKRIPLDDQSPETAARLRRLLRTQIEPMLGGIGLQGDQLRLIARLRDGGAVFYTEQGVTLPNPEGDDPIRQAPAWVAARPGRPVELLEPNLVSELTAGRSQLDLVGEQWIVTNDAAGPKLFQHTVFKKLLKKEDAEFTQVVGVDRRGRWLMRKPNARADDYSSTLQTLIIDPTLPDVAARLPIWIYTNAEQVGWDKEGWPAIQLGQVRMRLLEDRWQAMEPGQPLLTQPDAFTPARTELPPPLSVEVAVPATAATLPATLPTTYPMTQATTKPQTRPAAPTAARLAELGTPLYVDATGRRYYDGIATLLVVEPDGKEFGWTLPTTAVGQPPVTLLGGTDRKLFLFNQSGRVLRIAAKSVAGESFEVEATFTRDIPSGETAVRTWTDPCGRIVMAFDKRLAILFPSGYVPAPIRSMMEVGEDDD